MRRGHRRVAGEKSGAEVIATPPRCAPGPFEESEPERDPNRTFQRRRRRRRLKSDPLAAANVIQSAVAGAAT